jgi:hypothetical protein
MTNNITITVPVDVNEANPNRLKSVRQKIQVRKRHKVAAQWAWVAAGRPVAEALPVTVNVTIRRGRALDQDNAAASLKATMDGLFKEAITPDDAQKYVLLGTITQEVGKAWKLKPEVEFQCVQSEV